MSKYLVKETSNILFSTEHTIGYNDLNSGDHFGADRVLAVGIEAMIQFWASLGYADSKEMEGGTIIAVNNQIDYLHECCHGAKLSIGVGVEVASDKAMDIFCFMQLAGSEKEVARVCTRYLWFDFAEGKVSAIPQAMLSRLKVQSPAG